MPQFLFDPVWAAAFSVLLLAIGAAYIAIMNEPPA